MLIVITTAITYTSYSMTQITQLTETIGVQQEIRQDKNNESFDVVSVNIVNGQFNMTVKNTGDVPVHLTRLWVENTTDSSWPVSKYDIDFALAPGVTVKNIGQGVGLTALATQSYHSQIISERGNQKEMFLNTVGDSSIYTRVSATPAVMPSGFHTSVTLEVTNTGTTQLLNLQPEMVSVSTPTCTSCSTPVLESGPYPTSFGSLAPGDNAFFEWEYSFVGENGDNVLFEAGILNDARTDNVLVSLQTVESTLNAAVSIESGGLGDQDVLGDDILIFHLETTSQSAYQLYSGSEDAGTTGSNVQFTTPTLTPTFLTKNQTLANSIPAGNWEFALMLSSEFMSENINDIPDMIFHFEDGSGIRPANSQGDLTRNLMGCEIDVENVTPPDNDSSAHEHTKIGDLKMHVGSAELGKERTSAVRLESVEIGPGEQINSAFVIFQHEDKDDKTASGTTNVRIRGVLASGDLTEFTADQIDDITDRAPYTTEFVDWFVTADWGPGEVGDDTTTPDLSLIISEIVSDVVNWSQPGTIILVFEDHPDSPSNEVRKAQKPEESIYPQLEVNVGSGKYPDWEDDSGPHLSGSLLFNGNNDCLKSEIPVNTLQGNDLGTGDFTTSLWFKTTDIDLDIAEEMFLVNWEDGVNTCPDCEHFRIFLTSGTGATGGKITVSAASNTSGDDYSITTTNDYDDNEWYHVAAHVDASNADMDVQVTNLAGTVLFTRSITTSEDGSGIDIGSEHWRVGANAAEDGNYFKGYIDDVIHWDDAELLMGNEMNANARTNYGDGAHQFNVYVNKTDSDGMILDEPVYASILPFDVGFADPKTVVIDVNDDSTYTQMNMTVPMPQVDLATQERLNVTISWVSPTASWEALEVDMKFDDTDIAANANAGNSNPYASFLQIPEPDIGFPSYFVHDPGEEFVIYVRNTGDDGIFLTYQGSRVSFTGAMGSYAGLIHSANATGETETGGNDPDATCAVHCWWHLDQHHDSLHIPTGELARLYFYPATDIPSIEPIGNPMLDGSYTTTIWLNGYSDLGESFLRSIVVGSVDVVSP